MAFAFDPALVKEEIVQSRYQASIRFNELIPNSELHAFSKCGHWTQIEKRDRFVELVVPVLKAEA